MSEHDDSFDLLGLDFSAAVPKTQEPVEQIHYPSYQESNGVTPSAGASPGPSPSPSFLPNGEEMTEEADLKRYLVRCEGRWRVRSAPSLNSKVIGTIANGTTVVGQDCSGEILMEAVQETPSSTVQQDANLTPRSLHKAVESLTKLWVKVVRFEASEPVGVSEIRRDTATGGGIYCLRRNAVGYGLYQEDTEPQKGPLVHLPQALALELRLDAQHAASERTEDVSLTWKLLGAAESFGRFFSDEAGFSEDIKTPSSRRKPEDMFELKQRDQLKKAVASLRTPLKELTEKATEAGIDESNDLLAALPKDLSRRFARLRSLILSASAAANALVVRTSEPVPSDGQMVDGSIKELSGFIACCETLERTGAWACLDTKNRQEVIAFSTTHAADLQKHVRMRCKEMRDADVTPSTPQQPGLLDDLLETRPPSSSGGYGKSAAPTMVPPLLPPPPRSSCSVARGP